MGKKAFPTSHKLMIQLNAGQWRIQLFSLSAVADNKIFVFPIQVLLFAEASGSPARAGNLSYCYCNLYSELIRQEIMGLKACKIRRFSRNTDQITGIA
ncbi:hypothetical protein DITRI_Ditri10aG0021700 [Diplodiscus trichospermus]